MIPKASGCATSPFFSLKEYGRKLKISTSGKIKASGLKKQVWSQKNRKIANSLISSKKKLGSNNPATLLYLSIFYLEIE